MVVIYGSKTCMFCDLAVKLAESYNLNYEYRDAAEWKEIFLQQFPQAKTVPQILWNDRHIGGYNEFASEIENTLGGFGDGTL